MRTYEFHSALLPEEVTARLHSRTRRWDLDSLISPDAWFLQERKDGAVRLIHTKGRGYTFADLALSEAEDGTDVTATVSVTRTYILEITLIVLLAPGLAVCALLREGPDRWNLLLCFGWPVLFGIGITLWRRSQDRGQFPELVRFIEENLLK